MGIDWVSLLVGAVIGTIMGGIVSFWITKWGIQESFLQEKQMRIAENQKRWQRWFKSRPSFTGQNFDFAKYEDLIYEIRDWASTVRGSLETDGRQTALTTALTQYDRHIHLSSIASLLTFHAFPEELEKSILDLYIQTEYVFEKVQEYITGSDQSEREIICMMVKATQEEADVLIQKAKKEEFCIRSQAE